MERVLAAEGEETCCSAYGGVWREMRLTSDRHDRFAARLPDRYLDEQTTLGSEVGNSNPEAVVLGIRI